MVLNYGLNQTILILRYNLFFHPIVLFSHPLNVHAFGYEVGKDRINSLGIGFNPRKLLNAFNNLHIKVRNIKPYLRGLWFFLFWHISVKSFATKLRFWQIICHPNRRKMHP